jgi:hypothetical protein
MHTDFVPYENVDKEDAADGLDKAEQIVELARTQIVSKKFSDIKFTKWMYKFIESIGLLKDRKAEVVDVLCYTPDEFARKKEQISHCE